MTMNFSELHQHIQERLEQLGKELPGLISGFNRLHNKSVEPGALNAKTKELMALAISIAVRCEGCIAFHAHDAIKAGATRQELLETIGVAIMMGGGPASVYAAYALDAIDQFNSRDDIVKMAGKVPAEDDIKKLLTK
jgi:AhpD family alkylhydroperoxidase